MTYTLHVLNAFVSGSTGGNPAGVIIIPELESFPVESEMQAIARKAEKPETVFIKKLSATDYEMNYFTPVAKVALCGHATIAAFQLLKELGLNPGNYNIITVNGTLKIILDDEKVMMQQNKPKFYNKVTYPEIRECFSNLPDKHPALPIEIVSTGLKDIMLPIESHKDFLSMAPLEQNVKWLSHKYNVIGVHAFHIPLDEKTDPEGREIIMCRNFAPLYGIPEESGTGTANAALTCYLWHYHYNKKEELHLKFIQGNVTTNASKVYTDLKANKKGIQEIWVGGSSHYLEKISISI